MRVSLCFFFIFSRNNNPSSHKEKKRRSYSSSSSSSSSSSDALDESSSSSSSVTVRVSDLPSRSNIWLRSTPSSRRIEHERNKAPAEVHEFFNLRLSELVSPAAHCGRKIVSVISSSSMVCRKFLVDRPSFKNASKNFASFSKTSRHTLWNRGKVRRVRKINFLRASPSF